MPSKPHLKIKSKKSALNNHNNSDIQNLRESMSKSAQLRVDDDDGHLGKKVASTPQKDTNQIKSKFDPNNEVTIQNYATLDQDYRRNRPVRGNHHSSLH